MDEDKMIPRNIWETDCKYCRFRVSEENFEYGSRGKYETPCQEVMENVDTSNNGEMV